MVPAETHGYTVLAPAEPVRCVVVHAENIGPSTIFFRMVACGREVSSALSLKRAERVLGSAHNRSSNNSVDQALPFL